MEVREPAPSVSSRIALELLDELLVLLREIGVRGEQRLEFVGFALDRRLALLHAEREFLVVSLGPLGRVLVAFGLTRLREEDQRAAYAAWVEKARLRRMNGYGSQRRLTAMALAAIHSTTTIVCPTMYCGVPKKRAAASAPRPKASSPKAPCCVL
jgi:hypothetical protein